MKNRWLYLVITIPFIIGIIIGSFFDFEINAALYNAFGDPLKNVYGLIFSAIVPLISYFFMSFLAGYAFNFVFKEKNIVLKVILVILSIGCLGSAIYFSSDRIPSVNAFNNEKLIPLGIAISAVVETLFSVIGYFGAKKYNNREFLFASIFIILAFAVYLGIINNVIKDIFRRPRYRTLVEGAFYYEEATYMNWWQSFKETFEIMEAKYGHDAISENFKSFPSGHTGEASTLIFALPYFGILLPKLKGKETMLCLLGLLFTFLMGFSRMSMGAHYLSDVSWGALLTISCFIIANEINLKFFIKEKAGN